MKVSLNWLKQYVELPKDLSPEELALKLTMSTVEVERVINQSEQYKNMVVGEIIEIIDHPNADKLKVCKVKTGKDEYQVICGADNIYKGMTGVLALPGAMVKWHGTGDYVELEKAKIRGLESFGMLCAPSEIGLTGSFKEEDGVIDLKAVRAGQPAAEALGLNDVILEIDNKSINHRPDLWGHYGLAREVAAILDLKLKALEVAEKIEDGGEINLKIDIQDKENCSRYIGLALTNVKIEPSPDWMQNLLKAVGVRPINNIVDISNYVMMELGRPSHAFDRRQVIGDTIIVRRAKDGENFTTLDGVERKLDSSMSLVCDTRRSIDLAGIMGGENSEIKDDTAEIILELANFNPVNIRRTATALGLRTDAAVRFEKSLAPDLAEIGLRRILAFIQDLVPEAKIASKLVDINFEKEIKREIELSYDFINQKIGSEIPKKDVLKILDSLSFKYSDKKGVLAIEPPSFRSVKDIGIPEDIVEEVARIYGYDNFEPHMPMVSMEVPQDNPELDLEEKIKNILILAGGATEVYNYSFTGQKNLEILGLKEAEHLQLKNYFSEDQKFLRISLFENLINNLTDNLRFFDAINIFELGRIYLDKTGEYAAGRESNDFLPKQPKILAGLYFAKGQNNFYQAKGLVETLLNRLGVGYDYNYEAQVPEVWLDKSAHLEIKSGDDQIGWLAQLSGKVLNKLELTERVAVWQFNLAGLLKNSNQVNKFKALPKYPGIRYDVSMAVPREIPWADIRTAVLETSNLIKKVELFDIFEKGNFGSDKKSLAFHVDFLDSQKTLASEDTDKLRDQIIQVLKKKFKAEIR